MVTAAKGVVMAADKLGKLKTILQDVSIVFFLLAGEIGEGGTLYNAFNNVEFAAGLHDGILITALVLFGLAVIMTVVSGIHYVYVYGRNLESK